MAKFNQELPYDLIKEFDDLRQNCSDIFGEMCDAGADVVYANVLKNMRSAFKDTSRLEPHLRKTKKYRTLYDDAINVKVGFYGYLEGTEGKTTKFTRTRTYKSQARGRGGSIRSINGAKAGTTVIKTYSHNYGTPVPLIIIAREYGTSSGEKKKPFFRKSFNKKQIQDAMQKVQDKYIKGD